MRTARFFVPAEWIAVSAQAFSIPAGPLHQQITAVLRMKVGDPLSLLPNNSEEYDCRITEISSARIMGVIAGSIVEKPLSPKITVCAAITKRDTFEWMLEKCTELGASEFIPLLSDRVIKRSKEIAPRWHAIIKEASEQSGRMSLPTIFDPMTVGQSIGHTDGMVRIAMHEQGGSELPKIHPSSEIALFVGPEGGFTDEEIAVLKDTNAHLVTFGDLVFRAETAAIVGTALLRFQR